MFGFLMFDRTSGLERQCRSGEICKTKKKPCETLTFDYRSPRVIRFNVVFKAR